MCSLSLKPTDEKRIDGKTLTASHMEQRFGEIWGDGGDWGGFRRFGGDYGDLVRFRRFGKIRKKWGRLRRFNMFHFL